jgi:hypothetical protein
MMTRSREQHNKGRLLKIKTSIFLFSLFLTLLRASEVYANHNACSIKAEDNVEWVRVFDVDQDGNIKHGYSSGYYAREILWRGVLKKGQSHQIQSSNGEIIYEYKSSADDRSYGDNVASCSHGETISVP